MTVSTGMPDALACDDRSRLLAVRMLQGSAAATLFAYRLGETLDPVVHGWLRTALSRWWLCHAVGGPRSSRGGSSTCGWIW